MKKRISFNINFTNRAIYTFIAFGIFLLIGISVFALTPGVAPNPGHLIEEMAPPLNCEINQVLQWDGSTWTCTNSSSGGGGGGLLGAPKVFDSSGTYNKNELASRVVVWVVGGGGGAGGTITNRRGGAGAGGGTCIKTIESSSIGVTETVTIGAGGIAAGRNAFANGGSGGTSLFGSHCSATGGNGGGGSNAGGVNVKGGIGIDGDLNIAGGTGTTGKNSQGMMFGGGGTFIGGGGPASTDGRAYGGGAGMVDTWSNANGAAGVVVVWEYS